MVIGAAALATAAWAAPVVCDDLAASGLLAEAHIDEARAPVSHPELVPGLALASARSDEELRAAIHEFCAPAADGTVPRLSVSGAESWKAADWSAHTVLLTAAETRGCTLYERSIAISVGIRTGAAPHYTLRSRMPPSRTPVEDCAAVAQFRDERVLRGEDGPVRLVLLSDHEGDTVVHAEVAVRLATPDGWSERVVLDPAPPHLTGGGAGPTVDLTDRFEDKWVVAHGDRTGAPPDCRPLGGQTVWMPDDGWQPHTGADALRLLAGRGLWRMAGDDGWFLIVAQDDEEDADRLHARVRRLEAKHGKELLIVPSASFPLLNAGYLVAILGPWATEAEALTARNAWVPRAQAYVKQAWKATDPCEAP